MDLRRRLAALEEQARPPACRVDVTQLSDAALLRLAGLYDRVTGDGRDVLTAAETDEALLAIAEGGR
jgi:hypothetical protein